MPLRPDPTPRRASSSTPPRDRDNPRVNISVAARSLLQRIGICVLNTTNNVVAANDELTRLLAYPDSARGRIGASDMQKIHALATSSRAAQGEVWRAELRSGRRRYECQAIPLISQTGDPFNALSLLLIERPRTYLRMRERLIAEFHLTRREAEIVDLLVRGLTNKEIANTLRVSANTVKTLLHFVMIKLGMSTRAGIVGALLTRTE